MVSLYFHIPFCTKKCPYCHFFVMRKNPVHEQTLMDGLFLEWCWRLPMLQGKTITSLYFGGGTPSQLTPSHLASLLDLIKETHALDCEITLELNPDDATPELLKTYLQMGINRLSIGVQSFDNAQLKTLGRLHTSQTAQNAIHLAHKVGFKNISIDLMYDLPHQTLATWQHTLNVTKTLPITHLSLYNLTFEEPSAFHRKQKSLQPHLPSEEMSLKMHTMAIDQIPLERYEISAFGTPSIHNTGYWTARPFLGFGPSAFSYWEGKRFRNILNLPKYTQALQSEKSPVDFTEELAPKAKERELLAIHLRLLEGAPLPPMDRDIEKLIEKQWLKIEDDRLKLTEQGLLFYDSVASEIISG
ncbi:MAG: radical SAM family heme chaperone HemW [Chlamydiia bacterium]|nr:radical SAM family heme chaperone HemW [Chlamydiia bacterium]